MRSDEIIIQIYRGGVSGANPAVRRDKLIRAVADLSEPGLGFSDVCFHGFPRELVSAWDSLATIASDHGMGALASWGLDGERDNDGSSLTGKEKGEAMGSVLARGTCVAGLADAEGRYDSSTGPTDVTDEDDVLAMGEALRKKAPNALVGDQCWFAIDSHGEVRKTPLVADPKNVFRGFPVDEFARKCVNWFQFRQAYCNEAGFKAQWGRSRYEKVFAWMERDWALLKEPFAKAGLHYYPGITLQTYLWDDVPADLMHALITYNVQRSQPVIGWADYYPSATFLACVRGVKFLKQHGFAIAGRRATDAVKTYQVEYNRTAPMNRKIDMDGACGVKTLGSMGIIIAP
jgi:hypothetical protein